MGFAFLQKSLEIAIESAQHSGRATFYIEQVDVMASVEFTDWSDTEEPTDLLVTINCQKTGRESALRTRWCGQVTEACHFVPELFANIASGIQVRGEELWSYSAELKREQGHGTP